MHIRAETLDDLLRELYPALIERGSRVRAHRGDNLELVGTQLELDKPRARLSRTETRGRPFSALGEFLWYLTKDNRLDFIQPYIPQYAEESEDQITVNGGYGPRIFAQRGHNQLEDIIRQLTDSSTSRRAVIQIFNAEDNAKRPETGKRYKEVPCTTAMQFLLRDDRLHLITTMRSNDAYIGLPHDVFCFTMLQEIVARRLGIDVGVYRHFVGSMHLYEANVAAAKKYLDEGFQRTIEMPSMPEGDPGPSLRVVFDAERLIRRQTRVDADDLGLHPYWADLVRLLQIHFARAGNARRDSLVADFIHPGYRTFVRGLRGKSRSRAADPAQGTLSL